MTTEDRLNFNDETVYKETLLGELDYLNIGLLVGKIVEQTGVAHKESYFAISESIKKFVTLAKILQLRDRIKGGNRLTQLEDLCKELIVQRTILELFAEELTPGLPYLLAYFKILDSAVPF